MDNPWATAWEDTDIALPSWSAHTAPQWPAADASWVPSGAALRSREMPPEQDTTAQDQPRAISPTVSGPPSPTGASVSDHQVSCSTSPPRDSFCPVPETSDATLRSSVSVARVSDGRNLEAALNPPGDGWDVPWRTTSSSEDNPAETQPPDQWEAARQEKEKLNRAVPPELLDSLLRHCQQISQEIWPPSETSGKDDWSSGFADLADIAALLAQLVPVDSTLPPTVQFSTTCTAKAMNEALKLTRHLPVSASSPLSRLLATKGSLEWEKSIKAKPVVAQDTAHVGWRVLEKEDRLGTAEESKQRKATSGLLSFWNRRASAIQASPVEPTRERATSPARSSPEGVKSIPYPPSSQAPTLSKTSSPSVLTQPLQDSHPTAVATAPVSSAVSRFLNRFSLTRGAQHSSLALSSDDLEFLSDIVPSASDPPDEDTHDGAWGASTGVSSLSPLSPKLPPPIPPPPKQPTSSTHRLSSALGLGTFDGVGVNGTTFQMQGTNQTPNVSALDPPLSPKSVSSRTRNPSVSLKDVVAPIVAFGQPTIPSTQHKLQPSSQPKSQPHSSFTLPPPQKVPSLLSIPPLLPPPPVSPPQTPRPSAFPSIIAVGHSSAMRNTDSFSFHDSYDFDDEFTAFKSFPSSSPASFPSSDSYPSQRSPSAPSPPPRRTYERTHYPSSSSASSILSPASQTSVDQLCSTSSVFASLDSFGDFVSPSLAVQDDNRKPTPLPPLPPIKPRSQPLQPSRIDTLPSRVYHAHTPSQKLTPPTVHTSLLDSASSAPSVSRVEHQRTQSLVDHAAARGGLLWPNSPGSDERKMWAIPPPPSSSASPKSLIGEGFDLLGDGGLETFPAPPSIVGGTGTDSTSSPATDTLHAAFGVSDGRRKREGSRNQLQPSPPPLPSTSTPVLSFSSRGTLLAAPNTTAGSTQRSESRQTSGLSAQDISFFEGL